MRYGSPTRILQLKNGYVLADVKGQPFSGNVYISISEKMSFSSQKVVFIAAKNDAPDGWLEFLDEHGNSVLPDGYGVYNRMRGASVVDNGTIIIIHREEAEAYRKGVQNGSIMPYRSGVIDFLGEWVIQPDYQIIQASGEELFRTVHFHTKALGLYDRNGHLFGGEEYLWIDNQNDDRIYNNRIIVGNPDDRATYKAVLNKLEKATSMEEMKRMIETELPNVKKGCLDMSGDLVVPLKYSEINRFRYVYTTASGVDNAGVPYWVVIDTSGKELVRTSWDKMGIMHSDSTLLWVEKNGLKGVIDFNENVLVDPIYQSVDMKSGMDFIIAQDSERTYVLNRDNPGEQRTAIGPAKGCEFRKLHTGHALSSITEYRGNDRFVYSHLFDKRGNYLGDYTNIEVLSSFHGKNLPGGYVSVAAPQSKFPYILNLETGLKYKD
jgi:hypothetical protein